MNEQGVDHDPTTQAREAIEIVCSGEIKRLSEYYSHEMVDHVNDDVHLGHEGLMESYGFYKSIFDGGWRFEVVDQITEADRVASRWVLHGRCRGRAVDLAGMTLSTVNEKGQVREDFGHADTLSLLGQLGAFRSLRLGVEVLIGRVKLPKPAR
jgi:SnoaL-like polyketide cyclase